METDNKNCINTISWLSVDKMQLNLETALNFLWTTCIIFSVNHNYQCKLSELISI
jgi:hypothetical protein